MNFAVWKNIVIMSGYPFHRLKQTVWCLKSVWQLCMFWPDTLSNIKIYTQHIVTHLWERRRDNEQDDGDINDSGTSCSLNKQPISLPNSGCVLWEGWLSLRRDESQLVIWGSNLVNVVFRMWDVIMKTFMCRETACLLFLCNCIILAGEASEPVDARTLIKCLVVVLGKSNDYMMAHGLVESRLSCRAMWQYWSGCLFSNSTLVQRSTTIFICKTKLIRQSQCTGTLSHVNQPWSYRHCEIIVIALLQNSEQSQ